MTDTDRIEQRVYLAATPERVWRALTDATEFGAWFASELDAPFAEGRTVSMTCLGERFAIDIVEMTPPRRLVWRWHPGWVDHSLDYTKEPKTTTAFDLAPHADGTMLTVTETGFDAINAARRPSVFRDNVNGWLEQAASLRKYLESVG